MRFLFDTNVVLDVLLNRQPQAAPAASLFALVEKGAIHGFLGSTTVRTVHYLAEKHAGRETARDHLLTLLLLFDVAEVTKSTLLEALDSTFHDFEDAVLHQAGLAADVEGIVTRDRQDFADAQVPVFSPSELIAALEAPEIHDRRAT